MNFFIMSLPLYTSYSEETQTAIEEFLENSFGWEEEDLVDFVERFGETYFLTYFEEYADMVDDIGIGVVEAFLDVFDIDSISSCRDAYMGCYESGAEFAQSIAEDCGEVGSNSSWIEIDWDKSWDNLSYDYVESDNGHIFSQNF